MKRFVFMLGIAILAIGGCTDKKATDVVIDPDSAAEISGAETEVADASTPPMSGDGFSLNSDNTRIEFVGTHVGDKPDPRKGKFNKFSGTVGVDAGKVQSIIVDIDSESLETEIEKLTTHLKSPDFFDVRKYPKIVFQSKSISPASDGQVTITGDLTLMGVTKEISFPATVAVNEDRVTLKSNFEIDRTEFGMNYSPDKVEKIVAMSVTVSE